MLLVFHSGCYDEHERCQEWARAGLCALQGYFMAHTCRESCGVCGFLAPDNKEWFLSFTFVGNLSTIYFRMNKLLMENLILITTKIILIAVDINC